MTRPGVPPRKLHNAHFAFMRAVAQGLDERDSWNRYLRLEGEHTDLRTVRRTIGWIRDEFAAAAVRLNKPGTARLILMDTDRLPQSQVLPSLSEFAEASGMEDFSEDEQIEAYEQAYPASAGRAGQGGSGQPSRRGRLIARQLEALRWLQGQVVQDPQEGDSVAAWLNPSLAGRLERAGVSTLKALAARINAVGRRWWVDVPGVGQVKALRLQDWLHANAEVLGLRVGEHVNRPRRQVPATVLAAVLPAATAIRPYEKFVLPAGLDGSTGCFRALPESCLLMAVNDHEAIGAWLASKQPGKRAGALSSTQRAYRKEAERLLLWATLERRKALSSLSGEDALAYRTFLADPPTTWCGPRHHQRWSPLWRPLEGPLKAAALRQSLIVLRGMFEFLISRKYLTGNPMAAVPLPPDAQRPLGLDRKLTFEQWDHIDALLQTCIGTEAERRLRRGIRWLYATGLRLAEITSVKCEDLQQIAGGSGDGAAAPEWVLSVTGKGGRRRQVRVPTELVEELGDELARHGLEREAGAVANQGVHVMARFVAGSQQPASWSSSGLHQAIKAFLARAGDGLEKADAQQLKRASAHWLRHSHGSHALLGRQGQGPVPIQVVQNNLGHVSMATTSRYLATGRDENFDALRQTREGIDPG